MELIIQVWNMMFYGEMNMFYRVLLSSLILSTLIVFIILVFKLTIFVFSRSNYTLRRLVSSRRGGRDGRLKQFGNIIYIKDGWADTVLGRIHFNNKLSLEKAGIYTKSSLKWLILLKWVIIPLLSLWVFISYLNFEGTRDPIVMGLLTFVFLEGFIQFLVLQQISKEKSKFRKISYVLFKFLRNQLSAGVKITQALNNLPTIASDKILKKRLALVASHYASTNDIDGALKNITDYYQSLEAKSLALSIKQSIQTGQNESGFEQKEKKLFKMRLNVIKKNSQVMMFKYFLIGLLYAFVIILIIGYPQWLDVIDGKRMLFGNGG